MIRKKEIPLFIQANKLCSYFPDSTFCIEEFGNKMIWKGKLQPTGLSPVYKIKIVYQLGKHPDVYVIEPKVLQLPLNADKLKHVYDSEKQHVCLYYRKAKEWDMNKMIADTIIPWTSEWLMHYEFWVATGVWHGGGIEH